MSPMKKGILLAVILALGYSGWRLWQGSRSLWPAFGPIPSVSVVPTAAEQSVQEAVNTTGLPIHVPDGFSLSIFAEGLDAPRVMTFDPTGTMLVSNTTKGRVVALPDANGDGVADRTVNVLTGLDRVHGIAFHDGRLYVAETDEVSSYAYDTAALLATGKKHILDLPGGGNHFSRTIGFGPDGKLYVSVGSSCNVCKESDWRRARILVADADGSNVRSFASGLRNSVFFLWHPKTKDLWATDMGRDRIGDDTPKEEVNIVKDGGFYGWPYCYENRVQDKTFSDEVDTGDLCASSIAPHIMFQAHSAPLGLAIIPDSWPEMYRGDLLVSYHGSWNRTVPTGYKVARFDLSDTLESEGESDFLSGWLTDDGALGRPVDLVFDKNGTLFISDDKRGVVYRMGF